MLESGDLIFVKDDSDIGQAIQESTGHYSHVAIFLDGKVYHATMEGGVVCQEPVDFFKSDRVYDICRYPGIDLKEVKKLAVSFLGAPYNASFYPDGDGFYCSQFVAEILPIFEPIPMKFGDNMQKISDFWRDYYKELGLVVPLNQPGTNPSQLAASSLLVCKERNLYDSDF